MTQATKQYDSHDVTADALVEPRRARGWSRACWLRRSRSSLPAVATAPRPARTPTPTFAALVARLSETGGYFDSDNIITNEASYLQIASQLTKVGTHGGVYIGVGPDQNFSYIALIRPSIAFMVDIRRDNLLEHLLFKSLFALSRNRLEYLCLLFGKPVPPDIDKWTGRQIGRHPRATSSARRPIRRPLRRRGDRATSASRRFGVPLDARDRAMIDRYRSEFIVEASTRATRASAATTAWTIRSFGQLMLATDRGGRADRAISPTKSAFQFVRIDGGARSDRAGRRQRRRGQGGQGDRRSTRPNTISTISAFYLSNVEQYLIGRDGGFDAYARTSSRCRTTPRA